MRNKTGSFNTSRTAFGSVYTERTKLRLTEVTRLLKSFSQSKVVWKWNQLSWEGVVPYYWKERENGDFYLLSICCVSGTGLENLYDLIYSLHLSSEVSIYY